MRKLHPKDPSSEAAASQAGSGGPAPIEEGTPSSTGRTRKNVTRACDQCRKRRRKCNASLPCAACKHIGRKCTYDMDSKYGDLRRRRNTVQHVEQLRQQQAILDRLLELIRNSEADEAIQAVREGATFEEIANVLLRPPSGAAPSQTAASSSSDTAREESSRQATPDKSDGSGSDRPASTRCAKESDEATEYAVRVRRGNPDDGTSHPAPEPKERAMEPSLAGPKFPSGIRQGEQTSANPVWTGLATRLTAVELSKINMPIFSCDPYHIESDDMLSKTILTFRDGARKALQGNANVHDLIGSKKPNLDLFFRQRREGDPHTAWTWACELAKAYPLPLTVQLTGIFVAGIQMRVGVEFTLYRVAPEYLSEDQYFIHPCKETYDDLPVMLRPTRQQYAQPHAAGADICAIPPIKRYLLSHWDSYASLLDAGQYHNWPYSNQACLGWDRTRNKPTLSTAFLEHISDPKNHSVGAKILELVPEAAPYVVRAEESSRPEDAQ